MVAAVAETGTKGITSNIAPSAIQEILFVERIVPSHSVRSEFFLLLAMLDAGCSPGLFENRCP
jgi:hypothetical protein